jgi:hypothetical protein
MCTRYVPLLLGFVLLVFSLRIAYSSPDKKRRIIVDLASQCQVDKNPREMCYTIIFLATCHVKTCMALYMQGTGRRHG